MIKKINTLWFHVALIVFSIVADQATKLWAVARFTNEEGFPNYQKIQIIGDYLRFNLVFNKGAAFSSRPQDIAPFLPPWLFFLLLTIIAGGALVWFYKSIDKRDWLSRLGLAMVFGGAIGNFIDRMRMQQVVDFIDCDLPDFIMTRFPTFNVADSFVTVGVAFLILSPFVLKEIHKQIKSEEKQKKENRLQRTEDRGQNTEARD